MKRETNQPEGPWLEGWDMARQTQLIERLRANGESEAVTFGVAGFLTSLAHDLDVGGGRGTRAYYVKLNRYRKVLAELGPPAPVNGRRRQAGSAHKRAQKRRTERGAVDVRTATVLATCATVAALTGHPVALAVAPIILGSPPEGTGVPFVARAQPNSRAA